MIIMSSSLQKHAFMIIMFCEKQPWLILNTLGAKYQYQIGYWLACEIIRIWYLAYEIKDRKSVV